MPRLTLTLIGGPTVLIEYGSVRLLTDPTFDPPGTYRTHAYTLEKTTGPALSLAEIGNIDAVLLSHDQHLDNLDRAGRSMLSSVGKVYTTTGGASRLGQNAIGLAPFETCSVKGCGPEKLLITATPARHGPVGVEKFAGEVIGFALGTSKPGDLLYVTGDTVWYEGTTEVAERFSPKAVLLFTGAAQPRGRYHMTMGSEGAIEAAHAFPNAMLATAHNEGWSHLSESEAQLFDSFGQFELTGRLVRLQRGVATDFDI